MDDVKFAPGEWELFVNSNGVWWIEDEEEFIICEGDVYMSEVLLIAASKKMYELAKAVIEELEGECDSEECGQCELVRMAQSILDKVDKDD